MKKFILGLLVVLLLAPIMVFADDEKPKVNVYLFRGEGCPHCQEAEEWFASIEGEYGDRFNVVDYETWYNEDNAKLMQQVAESRGEKAEGVPYIIVGNMSWAGFTDSYESEILNEINSEYSKDVIDRYDVMDKLGTGTQKKKKKKEESSSKDVVSLFVILIIVGGVSFGIYKARSEN